MSTDEMVDVLDEFGRPTGQVVSKKQAHSQELFHSGTHIWIYNSRGEVLLQLRDPHKDIYPDTWDISAAGHISAGEDAIQTALRETEEELGIVLTPGELRYVGTTRADKFIPSLHKVHHVFDHTFIVHKDVEITSLRLQPGETVDARWCSLEELEADVRDAERVKQYSPRPRYFFDLAIFEIRKALGESSNE